MVLGTLYKRELAGYFMSPLAYIILFLTSLLNSAIFVFWVNFMVRTGSKDFTLFQVLFNSPFFWFVVLVQIPMISMRSFAEEFKLGTMEMLLTAPVREWEVVLAKYFGVVSLFVILWAPTAMNLVWVHVFNPERLPVVWGMTLLPYLLVLLLGMFYISIGVFASSLTKNQIVAGIVGFCLIFTVFFAGFLVYLFTDGPVREAVSYVSALEHMEIFTRGLFDTRPVVFYLTGTFFFLTLTHRVLEARRLKG